MPAPQLGPIVQACICAPDLDRTVAAWCGSLEHRQAGEDRVGAEEAQLWNQPGLAGARRTRLANALDEAWLEIIENTEAAVVNPFDHGGWFSLEINVQNVDELRTRIDESAFKVIGEPTNLDVSDDIRAMQLLGPAGEVLYLTEIKAEVPPFELPFARCAVDRLFIPVMLASSRDAAISIYERLNGTSSFKFDTKITVINRARGRPLETRYPVAALQFGGSHLIEIDQLDGITPRSPAECSMPAGIVMISFLTPQLPEKLDTYIIAHGPLAGRRAARMQGTEGEWIELIETKERSPNTKAIN
ncbi:MAG TPA: hypothetical protein VKN35_13760 [Xanthomonadales bacterium]|nr:hypothetical protein [Xanthomonadales bacterium]